LTAFGLNAAPFAPELGTDWRVGIGSAVGQTVIRDADTPVGYAIAPTTAGSKRTATENYLALIQAVKGSKTKLAKSQLDNFNQRLKTKGAQKCTITRFSDECGEKHGVGRGTPQYQHLGYKIVRKGGKSVYEYDD